MLETGMGERTVSRGEAGARRGARGLPPVLVLADHFGYAGGVEHGVTRYLLDVLPALREAGVEVTACFLRERHAAADTLAARGIHPVFFGAGKWDPRVLGQLHGLMRARRIGLVHVTGIKATLLARLAARAAGVRTLVHLHDLNAPGAVLGAAQRLAARETDLAVCVSEAVRSLAVSGYHVPPGRVRVLHNGVQLERLEAAPQMRARTRAALGIGASQPVATLLARMHPVKGHRGLIEVLPQVFAACPEAVVLLAGDGPERSACQARAAALGLGRRVRFLGQRGDVRELLAASDLLLAPSRSEGLGLAAIEALAAGRPVVAYAVEGLKEVVRDGINGRLVTPGDSAGFAAALIELLNSPERRCSLSRQARQSAAGFSLAAHVRGLLDCYRLALDAPPGAVNGGASRPDTRPGRPIRSDGRAC